MCWIYKGWHAWEAGYPDRAVEFVETGLVEAGNGRRHPGQDHAGLRGKPVPGDAGSDPAARAQAIEALGAGYVGGPTMAMIARKCPDIRVTVVGDQVFAAEFFKAGSDMPWWLAGTSMVATTFAADTPLAVAGMVGSNGVAGNWLWWNMVMSGMLTVFFFARRRQRSRSWHRWRACSALRRMLSRTCESWPGSAVTLSSAAASG